MARMQEALTVGLAAGAFAAGAAPAEAMPVDAAHQGPQAIAANVFHWEVVGGAPFKANGVHSPQEAARDMLSARGQKALRLEGNNTQDIKALDTEARKTLDHIPGNGGMKDCHIAPNVIYKAMISAGFDRKFNVELDGNKYPDGIPAFCLRAVKTWTQGGFKHKRTIEHAQAGTCDNYVLESVTNSKVKVHKPVVHHPKKPKPGETTTTTPTVVIINTNTNTNTNSQSQTQSQSQSQTQTQTQTTPSSPPAPASPNRPPTGTLVLPRHEYVNGKDKFCVENISDPDGDTAHVTSFSATDNNGNRVGTEVGPIFQLSGASTPTECQEYDAPSTTQQVNVNGIVSDGKPDGNTTLFDTMPIYPDQFK